MPPPLAEADGDEGDWTRQLPPALHTRCASRDARCEFRVSYVCSYLISFFDVDLCLLFHYSMHGKTMPANRNRPRIARLSSGIYRGINTSRLSRNW